MRGRLMSLGMEIAVRQDTKAVATVTALAAAGSSLCQQQPWQRRTTASCSNGCTSTVSGFAARFQRQTKRSTRHEFPPVPRISFYSIPDVFLRSCRGRDFSDGNVMFEEQTLSTDERLVLSEKHVTNSVKHDKCEKSSSLDGAKNGVEDRSNSSDNILKLEVATAMRPHPEKAAKGGEDAFFVGEGCTWIGVSDGVGGWASEGVDAGLYARELMRNCQKFASEAKGKKPSPKDVLVRAVSIVKAKGSATAVVAALHEKTLYVANIGDSGFLVLRNDSVFARSKPMQKDFNFPFQVGCMGDDPSTAETYEVSLCKGDVILLATDGLFDNLFESEIICIIQQAANHQDAATELTRCAQESKRVSPFSIAAGAAGFALEGGKLDDVTVILGAVG